jgi:hypothetical protein
MRDIAYPVILVTKIARELTLAHEIAHILLGTKEGDMHPATLRTGFGKTAEALTPEQVTQARDRAKLLHEKDYQGSLLPIDK